MSRSFTPKHLWQALKTIFTRAAAPVAASVIELLDPELEEWLDAQAAQQAEDDVTFGQSAGPDADDEPDYEKMCQPEQREVILSLDDQGRPHSEDGPALIVHHADNDDVQERTAFYMRHGEVVARAEYLSVSDEQGSLYRENWFDAAGLPHRDGAAAVIVRSNHYIPEETYLDEAREELWTHGVMTNAIDTTYEDIISHKPLSVRQAFGYDIG